MQIFKLFIKHIKMFLLGEVKKHLKKKLNSFLLHQTVPPPVVYFFMFFYVHYNRQQISSYSALTLSFIIIKLALMVNFNCAFMLAPFLAFGNPALGVLFFCISYLSCNQKWKLYLLFVAIGDAVTQIHSLNIFFLALASCFICFQTYHGLIFGSIDQNRQYFAGFFVIGLYSCIQIILQFINNNLHSGLMALILAVSTLLGKSIIEMRIQKLRATDPYKILNSRLTAYYLRMLREDIQISFVLKTKIQLHRRKCSNISCFCRGPTTISGCNFFIRQLYQDFARFFDHSRDPIFFQDYLIFLCEIGQIVRALHFLSAWKTDSYFTFTAKMRCQQRMSELMTDLNTQNLYEKEYEYALSYDHQFLHLMVSVNSILQQKLLFWAQASRQNPLMVKLQFLGNRIIEQMHALNSFYNQTIRIHEKKIFSFNATVVYSMYLLSATNFKEYAETIIKNTSKLLQEVYIFQNDIAQTFSIRIRLQNHKKSFLPHQKTNFRHINISDQNKHQKENNYKFVIDAVSNGFCGMIKVEKNQIIGKQLNYVIPNSYKEVHKYRLNYILNFDNQELADIIPSKLLHQELCLPFRGAQSSLTMGYICIKYLLDIQIGLSFVSTIKRVNNKTKNAIITVEGVIIEKQEGFFQQVLGHSEVRKYLRNALLSWQSAKVVEEQKFNLMINSCNYNITLNSPFLIFLVQKLDLETKSPPIHISVVNQEINKNKNTEYQPNNKTAKELKKMENVIAYQDNESSVSTKGSNAAINTVSNFSQSNSVAIYRYVLVGYFVVVALCFSANLVAYLTTDLSWDNTVQNNNPIKDTINMQKLQKVTVKFVSSLLDIQQFYLNSQHFNITQVNSFLGPLGYQAEMFLLFKNMEFQMKILMTELLQNQSPTLAEQIAEKWSAVINFTDRFVVPDQISQATQNLSYLQVMLNFVVDMNLAANKKNRNKIMIANVISVQFQNIQNSSNFIGAIDRQIDKDSRRSIFIQIAMIILVVLCLVPGWLFLRSRLPLHARIFDLIVSIDIEMVIKQIQSLEYVVNILKNYQDSSEILKGNVLGYQEKIRYPKQNIARKSSVQNQIIAGLQKYDYPKYQTGINESQSEHKHLANNQIKHSSTATRHVSQHTKSSFGSNTLPNYNLIRHHNQAKQLQNHRRRDGQLDYSGSQSDPKIKILPRHLTFYLIILVFTIFLAIGASINSGYIAQIKNKKNVIYSLINQHIIDSQIFFFGKLYFLSNASALQQQGQIITNLITQLQNFPIYDYSNHYDYSQIRSNCSVFYSNQSKFVVSQKYCEYNYTYLTVLGEFAALFKQCLEAKYNLDANYKSYLAKNQLYLDKQILYNISQQILYMQSLSNQLQNMTYGLVDLQFANMLTQSSNYRDLRQLLFLIAFCWACVCLIVGVLLITSMKRQYFKEVYMITLLNEEMITRSKRVESFLESLSKLSS